MILEKRCEAVEPFRGFGRLRDMWRSVLLGVVVAGLLAGCSLGSDRGAAKSRAGGGTAVVVRVSSNVVRPTWSARWTIDCNSDARWVAQVCAVVGAHPGRFKDTNYVDPRCNGAVPLTKMRVDGRIKGRPVHLREDSTCGPIGVHAWYSLLGHLHLYKPRPT